MTKTITIVYNTSQYIYKFRMNLIKKLQKQGYQIVVISPIDKYTQKFSEYNIKHIPIKMSQYGMNPLKELKTTYQIYKALKQVNPTASLHYTIKPNIFGNIAAFLRKIPVINNIAGAGMGFSDNHSLFGKLIKTLYKIGLKNAKIVFFQNNEDMHFFLDNKIVKAHQVVRIPGSGVDLSKYYSNKTPNSDTIIFLFIGRLLKEKGIEFYIKAAEKILLTNEYVYFKIVGEHEEQKGYITKNVLTQFVEHNNATYYGVISPDKMPEIIDDADCVILPSYYREGVPRSLLEAASMQKVIITTDSVGCRDVVDNGVNGFKCPIKNVECLVKSMQKVIDMSNSDRVKMGKMGREKMKKEFDETIVLNEYLTQIELISKIGNSDLVDHHITDYLDE